MERQLDKLALVSGTKALITNTRSKVYTRWSISVGLGQNPSKDHLVEIVDPSKVDIFVDVKSVEGPKLCDCRSLLVDIFTYIDG